MQDIGQWFQQSAQRMMLIYGQWDPWTAGAFTLGSAQDSFRFTQPQGTHGANLLGLDPTDRATAAAKIGQWLGVTPVALTAMTKGEAAMQPLRVPSAIVHGRRLAAAHRSELDPVLEN